jgi:4'-phosphopantetheinyl transferase EntD
MSEKILLLLFQLEALGVDVEKLLETKVEECEDIIMYQEYYSQLERAILESEYNVADVEIYLI